jgi:hypothetical protein
MYFRVFTVVCALPSYRGLGPHWLLYVTKRGGRGRIEKEEGRRRKMRRK